MILQKLNSNLNKACPCCSGRNYEACCLPYHQGKAPENALILMRSRYSAYALHLPDYIMETTHSLNAHYETNKDVWRNSILYFSEHTKFKKLEILNFEENEEVAYVTFIAFLEQHNKNASFQETSRFEQENGLWKYLEGITSPI